MQASLINAAPLMMNAAGREQERIGQALADSEFSRELEKLGKGLSALGSRKCKTSREYVPSTHPLSTGHVPVDDAVCRIKTADSNMRSCEDGTVRDNEGFAEPSSNIRQNSAVSKLSSKMVLKTKSLQGRMKSRLGFTDTAMTEKVLAQLKVPAEARQACNSTGDGPGRISIRALCNILDQQSNQQEQTSHAEVSAVDVMSLLQSLRLADGQFTPTVDTDGIEIKTQGSYSLDEFRSLLERIADRISQANVSHDTLLPFSHSQADISGLVSGAVDKASVQLEMQDHPQRLVDYATPSFQDDRTAWTAEGLIADRNTPNLEGKNGYTQLNAPGGVANPSDKASGDHQLQELRQQAKDVNVFSSMGSKSSISVQETKRATESFVPADGNINSNSIDSVSSAASIIAAAKTDTSSKIPAGNNDQTDSAPAGVSLNALADMAIKNGAHNEGGDLNSQGEGGTQGQSSLPGSGRSFPAMDVNGVRQFEEIFSAFTGPLRNDASGQNSLAMVHKDHLSLQQNAWTQDLGLRIQEMSHQGRDHITLELEPMELGKLVLRVETHNGQVNAAVSAESEQVRDLLMRNSTTLREFLHNEGMMLGNFSVDVRQQKNERSFDNPAGSRGERIKGVSTKSDARNASQPLDRVHSSDAMGDHIISIFA